MPIVIHQNHQNPSYPDRSLRCRSVIASMLGGLALASPTSWAQEITGGSLPFSREPHQINELQSGSRIYALQVQFRPFLPSGSSLSGYSGCTLTGTLGVSPSSISTPAEDFNLITKNYALDIGPTGEFDAEVLFEVLADEEIEPPELAQLYNESYEITCDAGDASQIELYGVHGVYGAQFVINDASTPRSPAANIPTRQKSLSTQLNSLRTLSLHNSVTRDRSIAKEIDRARQNSAGIRTDNLQVQLQGQSLAAGNLLGGAAGDAENFGRWGAFVTGNVDLGKQEKNSAIESDFQTNMLIAGVDYKASDNVVLGAAVTHSDTDAGDDETANTDFRRYSLSLFGSIYSGDRFYLDGMLTYGTSAYDLDRRIALDGGGADVSTADTDGDELSSSIGAGYNWYYKNVNARVFTFINYIDANIDGYAESVAGNSSAAVVDGMDLQSLIANLGAELSWNINTSAGVFTPMLSIAQERQYADDSVYVTGRFVGGLDEGNFAFSAQDRDNNYLNAQLGLNAVLKNGVSTFVSYDTFIDRKDFASGQFSVGARWEF